MKDMNTPEMIKKVDFAENGEFPDEMSIDCWRDSGKGICDFEAEFPCFDRNKMPV